VWACPGNLLTPFLSQACSSGMLAFTYCYWQQATLRICHYPTGFHVITVMLALQFSQTLDPVTTPAARDSRLRFVREVSVDT
jgi:hypothetical protein